MGMTPTRASEITRERDYLKTQYANRDRQYYINDLAYHGQFDKIMGLSRSAIGGLDDRKRRDSKIQSWNLMKPVVDATIANLARLPKLECRAIRANEAARTQATLREGFLYYLWQQSHMMAKHMEIGYSAGCFGASVHHLKPDFEMEMPVWFEREPRHTYPMPKGDGRTFKYVIFSWQEDAEMLASRYPELRDKFPRKGGSFYRTVDIIEYVSDTDYGFLFDGQWVPGADRGHEHDLGFCSVTITPIIKETGAGNVFGPADIDQLVAINILLNQLQTKTYDAVEENLYHRTITIGPEEVPIDTMPGSNTHLPEGSSFEMVPPPTIPNQVWIEMERMFEFTRIHANWSEVWSGQSGVSQGTGQFVRQLQSPRNAMVGIRQALLQEDIQQMNKWWLAMCEHYWPDKEYDCELEPNLGPLSAPGQPTEFAEIIKPRRDINGRYGNTVYYSAFGADLDRSLTIVQQLRQNKMMSLETAMGELPNIHDEQREKERIDAEDEREIQRQGRLQQMLEDIKTEGEMKRLQAQMQMQAQMQQGQMPQSLPGNMTALSQGQPSVMAPGGLPGGEANFPLPVTEVQPFSSALQQMGGQGGGQTSGQPPQGNVPQVRSGGGTAPGQNGGQPPSQVAEREVVTLDEAMAAIQGIGGKIKAGQVRSRSGGFKGDIYLMGEIVQRGQTADDIDVGYTVSADWQLLKNTLTEWRGRLVPHALTAPPAVGQIVVKGGQNAEQLPAASPTGQPERRVPAAVA